MTDCYTSIEFCAGAGGQALGLELAGFRHRLLVDNDPDCVRTLRLNRPEWAVEHSDIRNVSAASFRNVDLLAAGLPCPPFSVAGRQLGENDERNLFPDALRLVYESQPKFVLIENVRGFLDPAFADYRTFLRRQFENLGYCVDWKLLNASNFGVSQLRPRVAIVAARRDYWQYFSFPAPQDQEPPTVGTLLGDLMGANGWAGVDAWRQTACGIAPTIVGGSKKHGGPDLGPTRARKAWEKLGVNGSTIAEDAPLRDFDGQPRLTNRMVARLQGFPDTWKFHGRKTTSHRQIGNAFPPPVARAIGMQIRSALEQAECQSGNRRYAGL
jgi:DNA (cytosine-5)-methyltransferase 1